MVTRIKNHDRSELFKETKSIGNCPKCNEQLTETVLSYICPKNEGRGKVVISYFGKIPAEDGLIEQLLLDYLLIKN